MTLHQILISEDVVSLAQILLGATISTTIRGKTTAGIITETEAYKAPEDKGSHAYGNKRTKRTETLFAEAGTSYVYLCYGIHHLFNIVTGPKDVAHAVLIRAIEPSLGQEEMWYRRAIKTKGYSLTNGPGKLSQALGIKTAHNGINLLSDNSPISITLAEQKLSSINIIASPRVGIAYAKECAHLPWRFRIKNNPWTSLPHEVTYD